MESNNLIIVNEYDLSKQDLIYSHFMIMYIYNKVLARYYVPITIFSILITLNTIGIIMYLVNKEVIEPIQEMSQMTAFMLNPDLSQN